jgi:hypothetical protein
MGDEFAARIGKNGSLRIDLRQSADTELLTCRVFTMKGTRRPGGEASPAGPRRHALRHSFPDALQQLQSDEWLNLKSSHKAQRLKR